MRHMQFVFDEIAAAKHLVLIGMLMIEQVFICFGSVPKMLVVSVRRQTKLNKADNAQIVSWKRLSVSGKDEKAVGVDSLSVQQAAILTPIS